MILRLRGRRALSDFRLAKLLQSASASLPPLTLYAEFWHFVDVSRQLNAAERERLERILSYGPAAHDGAEKGECILVTPRPGTISPWSSKATDIARLCGLDAVRRIERGTVFWVNGVNPEQARSVLAPLLHDRMTETVFAAFEEADRLFAHFEPRPLRTVNILGDGVPALMQANREMGLALSDDEIAYLLENFTRMGRNPADVELMMFAIKYLTPIG
jgi:phosphoribosylformylglycinamidine synthase